LANRLRQDFGTEVGLPTGWPRLQLSPGVGLQFRLGLGPKGSTVAIRHRTVDVGAWTSSIRRLDRLPRPCCRSAASCWRATISATHSTACRPLLRPIAPDVRGFGKSAQPPREASSNLSTTWRRWWLPEPLRDLRYQPLARRCRFNDSAIW